MLYRARHRGPIARSRARGALAALLVPLLFAPVGVVAPAAADATAPTLAGTVYLPDGHTPAPAAVVDLMLTDPAGNAIPGSAFARGVADLDGHFSIDPRERDDLVARADANDGNLPVAVLVGKLAALGSIDASAVPVPGVPGADKAIARFATTLHVERAAAPDGGSPVARFGFVATVSPRAESIAGTAVSIVLGVARTAVDKAAVAGMITDRDLVVGNDSLNDPDLIPPLGAVVDEVVPIPSNDPTMTSESIVVSSPVNGALSTDLRSTRHEDGSDAVCGKDPGTYWVSSRLGNSPQGTKTYVYRDTVSCNRDSDQQRDEVVYKWGGYTGGADEHWSIYRLKFRTQIGNKVDYYMKYPDPVGDQTDGSMTWTVGFDYYVQAAISGRYNYHSKKIHGWQNDGTGLLYHVSWIAPGKAGEFGDGFRDGGGVNLDVPQGSDGRKGVADSVIVWRCYWDPKRNGEASCTD